MGDYKDLTGKQFGYWTVLGKSDNYGLNTQKEKSKRWRCKCKCGEERDVLERSLAIGASKSCGCLKSKMLSSQYKRNKYDLSGEYGVGYACNTGRQFLFDKDDYEKIKDIRWVEWDNKRYIGIRGYDPSQKDYVKMSWVVFGKRADHINHNTFDNRKENLRVATFSQNAANRGKQKNNKSGVIGVRKRGKMWQSYLRKDNILHIKSFSSFDEAVTDRLKMEAEYFREYAPQKHLFSKHGIKEIEG